MRHDIPAQLPARILMTRAQADCARWAGVLHTQGARVVYIDPFVTTPVRLEESVRVTLLNACTDDQTAWVVTSARAIDALANSDAELLARLRQRAFYTVGSGTADALRKAGFCRVQTAEGDITALASLIALTAPSQNFTRIIHLAGSVTVANLRDVLAQTPLAVDTHVIYHAEPAPLPAHVVADLISGEIGAVVLLSARVAEHIAATIKQQMTIVPRLYCLSSRIADRARAAFAPHVCEIVTAPRPDIAALLTMIDAPAADLQNTGATTQPTAS